MPCREVLDSSENLLDHLAADIRQSEIAALEAIGQPGVVEAEQVQDRRLEVVNVHRVFDDVEAEFVGRAES